MSAVSVVGRGSQREPGHRHGEDVCENAKMNDPDDAMTSQVHSRVH